MKKLFIVFISFLPLVLSAQLFDDDEYEYNTEIIWGINKNTIGGLIGGLMARYSRSTGLGGVYETFGLEIANVKHPSESKYPGIQGQMFIYGKANYLYAIRLQYGREKLMFKKAAQQGVQISLGASAGSTIGLVNPYYVMETDGVYERFDPLRHPSPEAIAGPGKPLQGLGDSRVTPGINLKGSTSFEFGTYRSNVAGVEIGIMLEAFTKEIVLVPTQSNKSRFTSIFFTLFWGTRK